MTESRLTGDASRGDREAFGRLVLECALAARRVAYNVLGSWDEADDAVQDAALAAWQALERYDPARPFRPWFLRIVTNAALDQARRRRVRRADQLSDTVAEPGPGPDQMTDRSLISGWVGQALERLPERQRIAVTLFDVEGWSHADIATALAVPEGTVRSYVFHGRRSLRRLLAPLMLEGSK